MNILPLTDDAETKKQVQKLSEKYFGQTGTLTSLSGGSFGLCWRVDFENQEKKVIKAYRVAGMNHTQAEETALLAAHSTVPFPQTLFVHDADAEIPLYAMGMGYVEGIVAVGAKPRLKSPKLRRAMADTVVTALLNIHRVKNDKFGLIGDAKFERWLDFYRPIAERVYRFTVEFGKEKGLSKSVVEMVKTAYQKFDRIFFEEVKEATLIHADLNVANIMVDPKTLQPTALIDPYGTMYADREFELHQLYNMNGNAYGLYDAYKRRFPVSESVDLKCAFYALFNEIDCYIQSGIKFDFIFPRQVRNLKKQLKKYEIL